MTARLYYTITGCFMKSILCDIGGVLPEFDFEKAIESISRE